MDKIPKSQKTGFRKYIRVGDVLLIAGSIVAACAIALVNILSGVGSARPGGAGDDVLAIGAAVVIRADGEVWRRLPLDADAVVIYESGGRRNVIAVVEGGVRMEEANCPDKLCVNQGPVSGANGVIVCLPNRVSVRIEKEEKNVHEVDVIVNN